MDFGNGFHRWNTIPTRWRSATMSIEFRYTSSPSSRISPVCRTPGISALSRLMDRRNVDFPQPDGPMRAVTARGGIVTDTSYNACFAPYQNENLLAEIVPG